MKQYDYVLDAGVYSTSFDTFPEVEAYCECLSTAGFAWRLVIDEKATGRTTVLETKDALESWRIGLERACAWKPQLPDENPKTAAAAMKPKISNVPVIASFALGAGMDDGARKYGRFNWRETNVTVSVFVDAMTRHLLAYYGGEDHAPDSKVHHLAHLMAGAAILLDAELYGVLNDDRHSTDKPITDILRILHRNV